MCIIPHDHDTRACECAALSDLVWCVPSGSLVLWLRLLRVYNRGVFLSRLASVGCAGWLAFSLLHPAASLRRSAHGLRFTCMVSLPLEPEWRGYCHLAVT